MAFKIKTGIPAKSYVIHVDKAGVTRHFEILMEFITRGVESPRGGGSRPLEREGWSEIHFHLNASVVEEYERRMAEPYPRAPRGKAVSADD